MKLNARDMLRHVTTKFFKLAGKALPSLHFIAASKRNGHLLMQCNWEKAPRLRVRAASFGVAKPSMIVAAEKTSTTPKKMARKRGQFSRPVNIM